MQAMVHHLKATIIGTNPPVWRRVVVPSDTTLDRLHTVLQAAFGWWDCHPHEFQFGGVRYGVPGGEGARPCRDEHGAELGAMVAEGASFLYAYDLGDYRLHRVVVERVEAAQGGGGYRRCSGAPRANHRPACRPPPN